MSRSPRVRRTSAHALKARIGGGKRKAGPLVAALAVAATLPFGAGVGRAATASPIPFCSRVGSTIQASAGAQAYCFGAQQGQAVSASGSASFGANVNAASPSEDISPSGVRAYGQSEVSIAGAGNYVVEAWNDSTGFFSPCPSPQNKEELTGLGFSADGGASFVDLGGVPNSHCSTRLLFGDPSVETYTSAGKTYFYVSSLFDSPYFGGKSNLALSACKAIGTGASAALNCGQPIKAASSTQCLGSYCSFLDKEFLTVDAARGLLYMSYTEFGVDYSTALFNGQIELAVCDLGPPSGGLGPLGGTAAKPVCEPGTQTAPYLVVAPGDQNCEQEGAYPTVDPATGDVYVGYEFNWASNLFGPGPCLSQPTQNVLKKIPASCLTLTPTSPCAGPSASQSVNVVSMDAAFIPGYNRFPASDFPRLAVSDSAGTVSMVWNDAGVHPMGDILLQSWKLGSITPVQGQPVRLNRDVGGLHFMPALRNTDASGKLQVSWYQRGSATTSITNVKAALGVDPRTTVTPASNTLITTVATDWNAVSSDIVPNFGDYTDIYAEAPSPGTAGGRVLVAWSDGRLGVPQPFAGVVQTP